MQDLLAAKRDLALPRALRKLDAYDLLILDDIGYVQQNAEEIEVLFTLMAERYERRSLLITSNMVFGEWDKIFKNPMTTAAAIDRVVHHSAILEFDVESYRAQDARKRAPADEGEGGRRAGAPHVAAPENALDDNYDFDATGRQLQNQLGAMVAVTEHYLAITGQNDRRQPAKVVDVDQASYPCLASKRECRLNNAASHEHAD